MKLGKAAMYTKFGLRAAAHGVTTGVLAVGAGVVTAIVAIPMTAHAIASERTNAFVKREAQRVGSPLSSVVAEG